MKKIIACFMLFCFTSSFVVPLTTASFADTKKTETKKEETKDAKAKETAWGNVVFVADFQAEAGVGKELAENARIFIEEAIVNTKKYQVVERTEQGKETVAGEIAYQQSGLCTQQSCAIETGQQLGADKLIFGTVRKLGDSYTIEAKFIDLRTAAIEASKSVNLKYVNQKNLKAKCQHIVNVIALEKKNDPEPKDVDEKVASGKKKSGFGGSTMYLLGAVVIGGLLALVGGGGGKGNDSGSGTTQTGPVPPLPPD